MRANRHTDNKFTVALKRILNTVKGDPKTSKYKRLWEKTLDATEALDDAWSYTSGNEGRSFNPLVLARYLSKAIISLDKIVPALDRAKYHDSLCVKCLTRRKRYTDMSNEELRTYALKKIEEASKPLYDASAMFWTFDHNKFKSAIPAAKAALQNLIETLKKSANSIKKDGNRVTDIRMNKQNESDDEQTVVVRKKPVIKALAILDSLLAKVKRKLKEHPSLRKTIRTLLSIRASLGVLLGIFHVQLARAQAINSFIKRLVFKAESDVTGAYSETYKASIRAIKEVLLSKALFYVYNRI